MMNLLRTLTLEFLYTFVKFLGHICEVDERIGSLAYHRHGKYCQREQRTGHKPRCLEAPLPSGHTALHHEQTLFQTVMGKTVGQRHSASRGRTLHKQILVSFLIDSVFQQHVAVSLILMHGMKLHQQHPGEGVPPLQDCHAPGYQEIHPVAVTEMTEFVEHHHFRFLIHIPIRQEDMPPESVRCILPALHEHTSRAVDHDFLASRKGHKTPGKGHKGIRKSHQRAYTP